MMRNKELTPRQTQGSILTNFQRQVNKELLWRPPGAACGGSSDELELEEMLIGPSAARKHHKSKRGHERKKKKEKIDPNPEPNPVPEPEPDENDNTIIDDTYNFVKSYVNTSPNVRPSSKEIFRARSRQDERRSFGSVFDQIRYIPTPSSGSYKYTDKDVTVSSSTGTGTGTGGTQTSTEYENDSVSCDNSSNDPKELTAQQRNRNLQLLRAWTDEGCYSRVQAMTIASTLYNSKVTDADIRAELTPKEKFAYKKFCLEIEDKLQLITRSSSSSGSQTPRCREPMSERTMRKMWHLYALYTKALSEEIWAEEEELPEDITARAIAHLVKKTVAGPDASGNTSDYAMKSLKPAEAMEEINPVLANCLKDPIHAFLIVYGRYVTTGRVNSPDNRLRKLVVFNQIAKEFFEKLVEPPEDVDIDTYLLLLKHQQQQSMRYKQKHHRRSNSTVPYHKSYHGKRRARRKRYMSTGITITDTAEKLIEKGDLKMAKEEKTAKEDDNSENAETPDLRTLQRKVQMVDGVTLFDESEDDDNLNRNFTFDATSKTLSVATSNTEILKKKKTKDVEVVEPPKICRPPATAVSTDLESETPKTKKKKKKKVLKLTTTASAPLTGVTTNGVGDEKPKKKKDGGAPKKKKKLPPPNLKDVLNRSHLGAKTKRPSTVPFEEFKRQDQYILRGKFPPKGCYILEDKVPPKHEFRHTIPENLFVTPESHRKKRICLSGCRYEVLPIVAAEAGFELVGENDLWNINWSDSPLAQEKIMQMRRIQDMYSVFWGLSAPLQKTNHFPGMYEICRKDRLGRNLNRLKRIFPSDYNFFPDTWDLPTEQSDLVSYAKRKRNVTFIIKPESGCQGKGIFLMKNVKKLSPFAKCVCQVYVPHPFLIDGYKFDQRIYVLITCVDPLRLYVYDEGIARFATVKYEVPTEENLEVVFMHLTNYSLNKFSESYQREGDGSKRKLSTIYTWMEENGHDVDKLTKSIDEIVVKTLLCAAPTLKHNYKTSFPKRERGCSCFELLGFDILVDRHLNPILLEVNHSPSFNLDLPVDTEVKTALLKDLLNMVYLGTELSPLQGKKEGGEDMSKVKKKKVKSHNSKVEDDPNATQTHISSTNIACCDGGVPKAIHQQFQHEMKNRGKFRLIYSSDKPGKYAKLMDETNTTYNGLAAVPWLHPDQQVKRRVTGPVVFESDPQEEWQPQRTSSVVKMTKTGQVYLETRLVDNNEGTVTPKKVHVQKTKDPEATKSKSLSKAGKSRSHVTSQSARPEWDQSPVVKRSSKFRSRSCKKIKS